jgi:hypothetical protein
MCRSDCGLWANFIALTKERDSTQLTSLPEPHILTVCFISYFILCHTIQTADIHYVQYSKLLIIQANNGEKMHK